MQNLRKILFWFFLNSSRKPVKLHHKRKFKLESYTNYVLYRGMINSFKFSWTIYFSDQHKPTIVIIMNNFSVDDLENANADLILYRKLQWWFMYIIPPTYAVIFLVGIIGNGSLLYMFGCNKILRTVPNLLIFNLAVGDLLALIFTVPFTVTIYTHTSWPFGAFICRASEFAKVLTHLKSSFL